MPARYAYSLNGENYTGCFTTRDEAMEAAIEAARVHDSQPQSVYVARRMEADPHAAGHARTVLREMAWSAHDEVGAPAATYLNQLSDEQINDLDRAIESALYDWLRRHDLLPKYFKVEGISEYPVPMPPTTAQASEAKEVSEIGTSIEAP